LIIPPGHGADRAGRISNRDYSALTKVEAILLDGHFVIEHGARSAQRPVFSTSTARPGVAPGGNRRRGGWEHDTLTEDTDLSYRAQLRGWQFRYLLDVEWPLRAAGGDERLQDQQHAGPKG